MAKPIETDFQNLADTLRVSLGASSVYLSRVQEDQEILFASGQMPAFKPCTVIPARYSICKVVAALARPLIIDDVQTYPLFKYDAYINYTRVGAYAGYPIKARTNDSSLVLCALYDRIHQWISEEVAEIEQAAARASGLVEQRAFT